MEILKKNIKKICGFYVSDWHLVTMLLPYINKEINEKANIITILENNIEENVKTLVSKLNLKNEKEILKLDWKPKKLVSKLQIKEILNNIDREQTINIILITGDKEFIRKINNYVEDALEKEATKSVKIINCFEVSEFNLNMSEILKSHDKILNTSGEREIADVFEGYA